MPWYRSRLSCSRLSFSCRKWPRYLCRRYRQALFLMDSENGQGMMRAGSWAGRAAGGSGLGAPARLLLQAAAGAAAAASRGRPAQASAKPKPGEAPPCPLGVGRPSGRPHRLCGAARARPGGDKSRKSPC